MRKSKSSRFKGNIVTQLRILTSGILLGYLGMVTSASAENLLELYQLAEQQDPQLKIAEAQRLTILEKEPQLRAVLLPQIAIGAEVTEALRVRNWLFGEEIENTSLGYEVSLSYALYRRDRQLALSQIGDVVKEVEAQYEGARQALIERVVTRYFAVLSSYDNLKLAKGAQKAFHRQLEQAQQRFEVGLIAITDVQEAQAGFDLAVAEEISAKNALDNAYEALREVTGQEHTTLATLAEDAPLPKPDPPNVTTWIQLALEQNPQLLATQHSVDSTQQEINIQQAAQLPTVNLVGRHGYTNVIRGDEPMGSYKTTNSIGVQLSYFLYEGGGIRSRVREAQQQYQRVLAELESQKRGVYRQTQQAFLNLQSSFSSAQALQQAVVSNKVALEAVKAGFEVGTRTSVDVLNAQRDLLRAQRDHLNARYNAILASVHLKQAAGALNTEDVANLNKWLTLHTIQLNNLPEEFE